MPLIEEQAHELANRPQRIQNLRTDHGSLFIKTAEDFSQRGALDMKAADLAAGIHIDTGAEERRSDGSVQGRSAKALGYIVA